MLDATTDNNRITPSVSFADSSLAKAPGFAVARGSLYADLPPSLREGDREAVEGVRTGRRVFGILLSNNSTVVQALLLPLLQ